MAACRRIGDLVCDTYLDTDLRVHRRRLARDEHGHHPRPGPALSQDRRTALSAPWPKRCSRISSGRATTSARAWPAGSSSARHGRAGKACTASRAGRTVRITGDEPFRRRFLHHWASIRRLDCATRAASRRANGPRAIPTKRRHRNLLRDRLAGRDDRRPATDRRSDDRRRPGADHAQRRARLAASVRGVVHLQHADGGRRVPSHVAHRFRPAPTRRI